MRRVILLGALLLTGIGGISQEKSIDNGYEIRGTIDGKYNASKVYLVTEKAIRGELVVVDSCEVIENKYIFKGAKPDVVKMYYIKSADPACLSPVAPFFLEEGITTLTHNANYFLDCRTKGGKQNELFNLYNAQGNELKDSIMNLAKEEEKFHDTMSEADKNKEYKRRSKMMKDGYNRIEKNFVIQYNDQVIAPFLLYWALLSDLTLEEMKTMRDQLDPKLNSHPYVKQLDDYIKLAEFGVGSVMPDFVLPDIQGNKVDIKSFRGKYVLVDFWASWCGPCRREMPNVVELYKACKGKHFEIIGISLDKDPSKWKDAIKSMNMSWPQLCDFKVWGTDPVRLCNIRAVPSTVLLDPEGKVIAMDLRGEKLVEQVKNILKK